MVRKFFKKFGFLILAVLIAVCGYIYVCAVGNEYTYLFTDYNSSSGITDVRIDDDSVGKAEITAWEISDTALTVHLKSVAPGRVYLSIVSEERMGIGIFYVHNNGVITNGLFFGDCTGCNAVIISVAVYLFLMLIHLIVKYVMLEKRSFYSYDNVLYLGLIIFAFFFIFAVCKGLYYKNGIYGAFRQALTSAKDFVLFTFPLVIVTTVCVTVSNIKLIRKEGRTWKNMLGMILGLTLGIGAVLPIIIGDIMQNSTIIDVHYERGIGYFFALFLESLIYSFVAYLECILLGTIITGIKTARHIPKFNKDFIIINGCRIRKDGTLTPLLKSRVDRAIEFAKMQMDRAGRPIVFVPSGGKGSDEVISEAEAMKRYLLEQGIDEKNILAEDKSTTTEENFKYSYDLIRKHHGSDFFSTVFCTTNYHVFRSGMLANELGIRAEGIGSKTKRYYWINAFVREYIATIAREKKTHILVAVTLFLINLIGSILMYISEAVLF